MKFFVPDWDDRVDPGYDFLTDRPTLNRDPYEDDVYAHEIIKQRVYDGILVSRMALGETGKKRERVDKMGMRAFLRLPIDLELLGDCGAYGYVKDKNPKFETGEVIDYYDRLGFDLGVSVDHLIVPQFDDQRAYRYELTLRNAGEFLRLYKGGCYKFTPVGAVQGWNVKTYVEAAKAVASMGYDYIAIGGLARSNSQTIRDVVTAITNALPRGVRTHVFGVARLSLLSLFLECKITSLDSAAPLRQAWLSARTNYHTLNRAYAAIRIPIAPEERAREGTLVERSEAPFLLLQEAERKALGAIRAYDRGIVKLKDALSTIVTYDKLLAERITEHTSSEELEALWELYRETLHDRPWTRCHCPICKELGVEVIIFRGNNRNRRRGFHNLWITRSRISYLASRVRKTEIENSVDKIGSRGNLG